jgi:branched-chain amino acid transport system ATP-binding protein
MPLLDARHLHKYFGGVHAVKDVSFALQAGELLALIGPNGAGKSTCFNMLNGQLRPDSGQILFDGADITGLAPREVWARGVGRTFQVAAAFGSMTVLENVQLALASHARKLGRIWGAFGARSRAGAMALLARVGMDGQAERACAVLAYGDVKRLEIAIAIAHAPRLLLMDEPTAGMAPQERHTVMALVADLARETNMGVLFTEHNMDVVFAFAQRVLVLSRGEVIASGAPDAVRGDTRVREIYLGSGTLPQARAART